MPRLTEGMEIVLQLVVEGYPTPPSWGEWDGMRRCREVGLVVPDEDGQWIPTARGLLEYASLEGEGLLLCPTFRANELP